MAAIRHRVDPGDVPADKAARRMGLNVTEFETLLPNLLSRGFPCADTTTGLYDLDAIDAWRKRRNNHLFEQQTIANAPSAHEAKALIKARLQGAFGARG
jgi:hypothetical protein